MNCMFFISNVKFEKLYRSKKMLKTLRNFFWSVDSSDNSEDELDLETAHIILKEGRNLEHLECNVQSSDDLDTGYDTYVKKGVITSKNDAGFLIDDVYHFSSPFEGFTVGSQISYTLIISQGRVKIVDVSLIENDWNVIQEKKSTWCTRIIVCKVIERNERKLVLDPGNIEIDLNTICSEFVPVIGDWIELDAKCEVDEYVMNLNGKILEINKIRPVRAQTKAGNITFWKQDEQIGSIDRNIYFSRESLSKGYIPIVGDKVICEIIESDQGRCTWRALKVLPEFLVKKSEDLICDVDIDFKDQHADVEITQGLSFNFTKLNQRNELLVDVNNVSDHAVLLEGVHLQRGNKQCTILNQISNVTMQPNTKIQISLECISRNIGRTSELIVFKFSDFKIGRWIDIIVNLHNKQCYSTERYQKAYNYTPKTSKDCIKGQNFSSAARFVNVKIPQYLIPEKFLRTITQCSGGAYNDIRLLEELRTNKPVLFKDLSYNNYEDIFHTLLYLDEIAALIAVSIYDQPAACFIKNGEYLMLEIENLKEKRPSIILGDKILATDIHSADAITYEGVVHKVAAKHVYLKFRQDFHSSYNGEDYGVHIVSNRASYRRMHYGVSNAIKNLGRELLFPSQVTEKAPQIKFKIHDPVSENKLPLGKMLTVKETLRKIEEFHLKKQSKLLISEDNGLGETCNSESPLVTTASQAGVTLEWYNSTFNFYQKEAVRNILSGVARPLPYIIFGPPGTGKTVTLVEAILQITRLIGHARLLVAAPSNSAADLLALRLIDSGVIKPGDLVRLVSLTHMNSQSIPARLIPYCTFPNVAAEGTHVREITVLNNGLAIDCTAEVLGRHRITITTCSSAGMLHQMGFPRGHFSHILVDEASQASEPEVMIPLSFFDRDTGQIVLAGDPMQLGPVVLAKHAEELGLGESYQERLINRFPYIRDPEGFPKTGGYDPRLVTKLLYNYRSLSPLLTISSNMFYNGELIPTISHTDSEESKLLHKLEDVLPKTVKGDVPAIVFHGVSGQNFQTSDSPSWFNPDEASQVFYYVNEFYRLGLISDDIGIITPYVKQVKEIRSVLAEAEFDVPKVGSVEDFQGQEFNVVLLSTVRSDETYLQTDVSYCLGFVSNPRRLNVAITRAKSLLVIIGNPNLLGKDVHWRTIIKYCLENGAYTGCDIIV